MGRELRLDSESERILRDNVISVEYNSTAWDNVFGFGRKNGWYYIKLRVFLGEGE